MKHALLVFLFLTACGTEYPEGYLGGNQTNTPTIVPTVVTSPTPTPSPSPTPKSFFTQCTELGACKHKTSTFYPKGNYFVCEIGKHKYRSDKVNLAKRFKKCAL